MTREEALKIFGIKENLSPDLLNQLYKNLQKAAHLRGRGDSIKRLNIARDILLGKTIADTPESKSTPKPLFSGHTYATCSTHSQKTILDWEYVFKPNGDDEIHFSNQRMMSFDLALSSLFKKFKTRSQESEQPNNMRGFTSADYKLPASGCMLCTHPHFDLCEHCNTIHCHAARDRSLEIQSYECPGCGAKFGWGESFGGKPRIKKIDARQFRTLETNSLTQISQEERKLITR